MRSPFLFACALACAAAAAAQAPAPRSPGAPLTREPLEGRANQKVERIEHEDAGNRIEELRYGGQTERITVQPKNGMPEYEVGPDRAQSSRPADTRDGPASAAGQRRWNVLRF
ncbi:hypothetical protein [Ramlibacter rhizophilus]|uniref:DUF2782 domain-containing protein n=1 Tax=Ramlibacter rhizophilus TaxID=1781167 RepID=A0A4Z0BFK4_9BURK|nr:hypothetical protein [Ramlibacter rhizophilus]TFY96904.1 hypothetical protein EZ242_19735 [Ramlibacter rhizophilus]